MTDRPSASAITLVHAHFQLLQQLLLGADPGYREAMLEPANLIQRQKSQLDRSRSRHINEITALCSRFTRISSLRIAGIYDMRILMQHSAMMDMAKCPIIEAFAANKLVQRTWCIWVMRAVAVNIAMQQRDMKRCFRLNLIAAAIFSVTIRVP